MFILCFALLQAGACSPAACEDMAAEGGLRLLDRVHLGVEPDVRDVMGPTDFVLWTKKELGNEVTVSISPGAAHESVDCTAAQRSIAGKVALGCFRVARSGEVLVRLTGQVKCPGTIWNRTVTSSTAPRVFRFTVSGPRQP